MNRPQRFRGLATGPGVQRKAPRTVIQRENKPKGPRLEEQHEEGRRERSQQLIPASKDFSLMHLVTRVHWENNQPRKYDMTLYLIDTTANNVVVSTHKTFFAAVTRRHDLAKSENRRGFGGLEVVELHLPAKKRTELTHADISEWITNDSAA